eukprot:3692514-Pyramimonas_sp.AAC.1
MPKPCARTRGRPLVSSPAPQDKQTAASPHTEDAQGGGRSEEQGRYAGTSGHTPETTRPSACFAR